MSMQSLSAEIVYSWQPFTLSGRHLNFDEHVVSRLTEGQCSCWGAAIYKWEGQMHTGPHAGKTGVLIGETANLRQRIKQYIRGTQECGNKHWREDFLCMGDVRLYYLQLETFSVSGRMVDDAKDVFSSNNRRIVLEQLLVMNEVANAGDTVWVVNARQ